MTEKALKQQIKTDAGAGALFGASERFRSQRGVRERFRRGLEDSGAYDARFREIVRRHGLPDDLAYLPYVDSLFQINARSSAGASGMLQFMRSTGRQFMVVNAFIDERLDPVAAARYLPALSDHPVTLRYGVTLDELARRYRVPRSVLISRNHAWLRPVHI